VPATRSIISLLYCTWKQ